MISDININSHALKVEKQNAKAMIDGFRKNNNRYYVTIFCAHKKAKSIENDFKKRPKILTATRRSRPNKEYPLSPIGENLNANNYDIPAKYIAVLDRIFHIDNDIKIWEELCNNGVFDIWEPQAPFNNLDGKIDQMILLLRIFQIDCDLTKQIERGTYFDKITEQNVKIVRPIIHNNEFEDIINKVKDAVSPYLRRRREELVFDTTSLTEYKGKTHGGKIYQPPEPSKEEFENAIKKLNEKDLKSNDAEIKTLRRIEQGYLRSQLFKRSEYFDCGICGNKYPVLFLVAAHIKKRSECTLKEQNDKSIVMPMCNFGCDELYENGYISVKEGSVIQIKKEPMTPLIQDYIDKIEGKYCKYWNKSTSEYFNWHSEDSKKEGKGL